MSPTNFKLDVVSSGDTPVFELAGEIDLLTAPDVTEAFTRIIEDGHTEVIVDTTEVTFIDSTGLHALIDGYNHIHDTGSRFLVVPSPAVQRLLELTGLEEHFEIHQSRAEALTAIEGANSVEM